MPWSRFLLSFSLSLLFGHKRISTPSIFFLSSSLSLSFCLCLSYLDTGKVKLLCLTEGKRDTRGGERKKKKILSPVFSFGNRCDTAAAIIIIMAVIRIFRRHPIVRISIGTKWPILALFNHVVCIYIGPVVGVTGSERVFNRSFRREIWLWRSIRNVDEEYGKATCFDCRRFVCVCVCWPHHLSLSLSRFTDCHPFKNPYVYRWEQ